MANKYSSIGKKLREKSLGELFTGFGKTGTPTPNKTISKKQTTQTNNTSTQDKIPQKQTFEQFQKSTFLHNRFKRLTSRTEEERKADEKSNKPQNINVAGGYFSKASQKLADSPIGQFGKAVSGTLVKNTTDLAMNATQGFIQATQEGVVGAQKLVTGNKDIYDTEREARIKQWQKDWYRTNPEDKPIMPTDSTKQYYEQAYKDATDRLDRLNAGTDAARKMDIYEGDYEGAQTIGALTSANKGIEKAQTKVDESLTGFADLENQPYATRFVANAVGSVPTSVVSLIPFGVGFSINYMAQKQSAIDQKYAELTANGRKLTNQDAADIFTYGTYSALIEAGSEQIWSFGGIGTSTAKQLAAQMLKAPTKSVIKQLVKEAVKSGAQEGFEEIVSGLGQGMLAKITTDKDATLFSLADETSLIYLFGEGGLAEQAASGFVMGSMMNTATSYANKDAFKKTNEYYESIITIDGQQMKVKDVPLEKLTFEIQEGGMEALLADLKKPETVAIVQKQTAVTAEQIEKGQPIDKQIKNKRDILTNAYKSVAENKTPEQQAQYEKLTGTLKPEIAQDEEYKKSLAKVKSKYTASQLTDKIDRKDAEIAELETELADASTEDKASIQEEIMLQKSLRENYRATLERVATITPDMSTHSTELVSSKPVDPVAEETNNVAMQEEDGVKTATGGIVESPMIKNAPSGNVIESIKSPNKHVFSTAKAVQIGDIIASTDAYGNVNPKFPKERQPRFVERKSSTEQIADIAYKTDFMAYAGIERVQDGVPMVSADGVGIIGNHRLAALLLMFKENIAKFRQYQAYMIKNASKFGLNPAKMTGDFIVVRVLSPDEDLDSLVNEGNVSGTAAMSASEIAVGDSKKLSDSIMAWFVTDENGEMTGAQNKTFNNRFINEVVPESERASMRDGNGEISMNGLRRIQNAMFYKAYGNIDLLTRVSESTNNNVKKLTNTLINVSPRIVTLKEGIAAGKYYDVATAQLITDVATKWVIMKQSKEGKDVLAYLKGTAKQRQADMFNEKENPLEMSMILAFEVNRGSGKNLTSLINRIIDLHMAEGTPENGFFGLDQKTVNLETIINTALEGKEYGTIQDLENLYAESGDGSEGAVTAVGSVERGQKESEPVKVAAQEVQGEATASKEVTETIVPAVQADEGRKQKIARRKEVRIQLEAIYSKYGADLEGKIATKYVALGREFSELTFDLRPKINPEKIKSPEERKSTLTLETIKAIHNDMYKNKTAFLAIDEAAHGTFQSANTAVDNIVEGKNRAISPVEFYGLFSDTRNALRKQYGDTITLYRSEGQQKAKATKNYATTREAAQEYFDLQKGTRVIKLITPIENVIAANVTGNGNYHEIIVGEPPVKNTDVVTTSSNKEQTLDEEIKSDIKKPSSETAIKKAIADAESKYKTHGDVVEAIEKLRKDALTEVSKTEEKRSEDGLLQMNLQLFALSELAKRFKDVPEGGRLHSYIDTFNDMLTRGTTAEMQAFLEARLPTEIFFYETLGNKESINLSEKKMKDNGEKYLIDLYSQLLDKPNIELKPDELISLSKYLVDLTSSAEPDIVSRGILGLEALSDKLTRAGQFIQSVRILNSLIPERKAYSMVRELDRDTSDDIDKKTLSNATDETKRVITEETKKAIDAAVKEYDRQTKNKDSSDVDKEVKKGEKPSLEKVLASMIKADIVPHVSKEQTADQIALKILHGIYTELNPKSTKPGGDVFNELALMAINRNKYGNVWDKAKPLVQKAIDEENIKRLENGISPLEVPQNYIERYRDPDFTVRMMNQSIRKVLEYNGTTIQAEARKYFIGGVSSEEAINKFVQGLKDKFDILSTDEFPSDAFAYLKENILKQYKNNLNKARETIRSRIRKTVEMQGRKKAIGNKSSIEKTIDQLTDAVISDSLSDDEINKVWANRLGVNYITSEMKDSIYENMIRIEKIADEYERDSAYEQFVSSIASQIKATNWQKAYAWRRFAMLISPTSWIRNGVSNIAAKPFYAVTDAVTNVLQKALKIDSEYRIRGKRHIREGQNAEIDAVVSTVVTRSRIQRIVDESAKYQIKQLIQAERKIFETSWIEKMTKAPLNVMSTGKFTRTSKHGLSFLGDAMMLERHYKDAFRNKLNALGYTESLSETRKQEMIAIAANTAKEVGITRTYRELGEIASKLNALKNSSASNMEIKKLVESGQLNKARAKRARVQSLSMAIDFAVPFITTPMAIAVEAYRFSPVALGSSLIQLGVAKAKGVTKTDSRYTAELTQKMSQALVGSAGQWVIGFMLASLGVLTGAAPDGEKEKQAWELEGKKPYSIYIKGFGSISINWLQPVALGLMGGAESYNTIAKGGTSIDTVFSAATAGIEGMLSDTTVSSIKKLFGSRDGITGDLKNLTTSGVFQFFPTILKRFATSLDPYTRDTYSGEASQILINRGVSYLPVGSMAQPMQVDIWGNPVENEDLGMGIFGRSLLNLITPFNVSSAKMDNVSNEVVRLFNETGDTACLPVIVNAKWTKEYKDKKYSFDLSGQDYVDYQTMMGKTAYKYVEKTIKTSDYKKLSDKKKIKVLVAVYKEASSDAKEKYIRTHT